MLFRSWQISCMHEMLTPQRCLQWTRMHFVPRAAAHLAVLAAAPASQTSKKLMQGWLRMVLQ